MAKKGIKETATQYRRRRALIRQGKNPFTGRFWKKQAEVRPAFIPAVLVRRAGTVVKVLGGQTDA